MPDLTLELAIQDAYGIELARSLNPNRIELCSALTLGGLSPSPAMLHAAIAGGLNVHVLIRPRAGDFEYDAYDVALMHTEIDYALTAGARGVVVGASKGGVLNRGFITDVLQQVGADTEVTVHRVIDAVTNPESDLEWLAQSQVKRVLTSGAANTAARGMETLATYVAQWGTALEIMAGGGVQLEDVPTLASIGVAAIHTSAKQTVMGARGVELGTDASAGAMMHDTINPELARQFQTAIRNLANRTN